IGLHLLREHHVGGADHDERRQRDDRDRETDAVMPFQRAWKPSLAAALRHHANPIRGFEPVSRRLRLEPVNEPISGLSHPWIGRRPPPPESEIARKPRSATHVMA